MLERKWLISIRITGVYCASHRKRIGSDGVAPENSSITPAAATSSASTDGPTATIAGRYSRQKRIWLPSAEPHHSLFARRGVRVTATVCG